jgi:hypothetical protein
MFEQHRDEEPIVGDDVVTADDLANGDIVYFERVARNRVVVRQVTHESLATYDGPIFTVIIRDASGKADFKQVSRDDVE